MRKTLTVLFLAGGAAMSSADAAVTTGPEVGERIPAFELKDHRGRTQTFDSLKGENGLLLIFTRSADW